MFRQAPAHACRLTQTGFASQSYVMPARRTQFDCPGFEFCDFPQWVWGWRRRGDSTAAATTAGFYDWAFDKHGQHRPGKLERAVNVTVNGLTLFRKRASDAFRGSGRSDQYPASPFSVSQGRRLP